jgi:small subunit ribosomal protein S17
MARKLVGTVASDVQDKTIVVAVARRVTHPVYGKQYTVTKRFAVHDENNEAHVGDKVEIVETRPISKNKSFRLARVIETGHATTELKDETEEVTKPAKAETAEEIDTKSSRSAEASTLGQAEETQTAAGSSREAE